MLNKQGSNDKSSHPSVIPFKPNNQINKEVNEKHNEQTMEPSKKKELPTPKLQVSLGTLMEIEKWVKKANVGKTRYAFKPIMEQIEFNGDELFDAIHSLTLAQIMPYKEMRRHIRTHELSPLYDDFGFVYSLAKRYRTEQENVVERIHHVRQINVFLKEQKELAKNGPFRD